MRMTASWCDPHTDRPNTRLWRDFCAPMAKLPSDQVVPIFRLQDCLLMSMKGESPTIGIHTASERRMNLCNVAATIMMARGCAFAVKPRALGAPQAALGLDRSAHPSKRTTMPQMQSGDVTK